MRAILGPYIVLCVVLMPLSALLGVSLVFLRRAVRKGICTSNGRKAESRWEFHQWPRPHYQKMKK